jgi:hypothetical protein
VRSQELPPPPPGSTHTLHAALHRATHSSLGSIVLSALILTGLRLLSLSTTFLAWAPLAAPLAARPYVTPAAGSLAYVVAWIERAVHARALSAHALVYVGLTGDPFVPAARRARELTAIVEDTGAGAGAYRRKFKTEREHSSATCALRAALTPPQRR